MGAKKFMNELKGNPLTSSLFEKGLLSATRCKQIVNNFRRRYYRIPQLWESYERCFRIAMRPDAAIAAGEVSFFHKQGSVHIKLPSGRLIRYICTRLVKIKSPVQYIDDEGNDKEFTPQGLSIKYGGSDVGTKLYGGKIVENIVQAIARDILVEAILRIEQRGIPILFHVHDEVIAEVPIETATEAKQVVTKEMTRQVSWMPDLPLSCESHLAQRYCK